MSTNDQAGDGASPAGESNVEPCQGDHNHPNNWTTPPEHEEQVTGPPASEFEEHDEESEA